MDVRVITLKYHDGLQGFPEQAIRDAAGGREILEVRERFFRHGGVPHLALVLFLGGQGGHGPTRPATGGFTRFSSPDPALGLPQGLQKLYRDLRQWRNDRAKQDGLPSYVIMRNNLLAEICRRLPRSLAQLREIDGIGEATCAKYGEAILGLLASVPDSAASPSPDGSGADTRSSSETKEPASPAVVPK